MEILLSKPLSTYSETFLPLDNDHEPLSVSLDKARPGTRLWIMCVMSQYACNVDRRVHKPKGKGSHSEIFPRQPGLRVNQRVTCPRMTGVVFSQLGVRDDIV